MNPFFRRSTFWKDLLPICWKSQPILFGLLQGAHVAVAVRLLLVFLLFLPVRWTRTTKYAKKGQNANPLLPIVEDNNAARILSQLGNLKKIPQKLNELS
jgi:hypothetical protein